jgi:hypothetical protein
VDLSCAQLARLPPQSTSHNFVHPSVTDVKSAECINIYIDSVLLWIEECKQARVVRREHG